MQRSGHAPTVSVRRKRAGGDCRSMIFVQRPVTLSGRSSKHEPPMISTAFFKESALASPPPIAPLGRLRQSNMAELVAEVLRQRIVDGQLADGDLLPSRRIWRVSSAPVRRQYEKACAFWKVKDSSPSGVVVSAGPWCMLRLREALPTLWDWCWRAARSSSKRSARSFTIWSRSAPASAPSVATAARPSCRSCATSTKGSSVILVT